MLIKVDNRETDLIPLIERRLEAYPLETTEVVTANVSAVKKNKGGCLVPLHTFQDVDVNNEVLSENDKTREPGDAGENNKDKDKNMISTKIVKVDPQTPDHHILKEAAHLLASGGLVIIPTETVYGIAANKLDVAA